LEELKVLLTNPLAFVFFFARGCCHYGSQCRFWHRLPCEEDREEIPYDVFGRERHAEFRDDMGGTGAFGRENKTLYIGRIAPYPNMEEVITRYFSPYGEIAKINVLKAKGVAFIEYTRRIYSEFAKEAMANQKLERKEILNVRWATEDPNPGSTDDSREAELLVQKALAEIYPSEYALPAEFRQNNSDSEDSDLHTSASKRARIDTDNHLQHSNIDLIQQTTMHSTPVSNTNLPVQTSLISPEVLHALGYMSQQISYTRAHLAKPVTNSKIEATTKNSKSMISLVDEYSDSSEDS